MMVFKIFCVIVLWTKIAAALKRLTSLHLYIFVRCRSNDWREVCCIVILMVKRLLELIYAGMVHYFLALSGKGLGWLMWRRLHSWYLRRLYPGRGVIMPRVGVTLCVDHTHMLNPFIPRGTRWSSQAYTQFLYQKSHIEDNSRHRTTHSSSIKKMCLIITYLLNTHFMWCLMNAVWTVKDLKQLAK